MKEESMNKPTSIEKQNLVDNIKNGFRPEDVVVRVTPQQKKSVTQMIQLYDKPNDPQQKFVEVNETYRWGYGYKEGDDMNYPYMWNQTQLFCDNQVGHGAELDDLCGVYFDYDGPWTQEEKEDFENKWHNGDPADEDGRSGFAWVYDYQDTWQVEDEQLVVDGPFKFDVMDKNDYGKIYMEDWQPPAEEKIKNND